MVQKVTVLGGAGFVGTRFCQVLRDKQIRFEIIDLKKSLEFEEYSVLGDVRNVQSLRDTISGDVVVNLAAVHRDDVKDQSEYYKTNVLGAQNLAAVCAEKQIKKIVFTSSVAVYGFAEKGVGEDGPINPFNEYGITKYQAEKVFSEWLREDQDRSLLIVRPTVIFGEGNRGNVFNLLNQIASGFFLMIGSGENQKSMAYVGNVAAFLSFCIDAKERDAVFNYVDSPDFSMNTLVTQVRSRLQNKAGVGPRIPFWLGYFLGKLADIVSTISRRNLPVSSLRVKKFCSDSAFSSNKFALDGFVAPFSLEEGLDRTLESEFINPDPSRQIFFTE